MSRLILNSAANFTARIVSAVLGVISVPLYLRYLGQDAFGLMAFVTATQSLLSLLDLGLAATANREIARESSDAMRADITRTLEFVYWGTACGVFFVSIAGAAFAAEHWLNLGPRLDPATAWLALSLAGLAVAVRWPVALYSGVLQGLEQQVHANAVVIGAALFRTLGGVVIVMWISATISAVFIWYIFSAFAEVWLARHISVRQLGRGAHAVSRFRKHIIQRVWKTATALSLVGALGTLGASMDKLLLSRHLTVGELGIYSSIAMLASVLMVIGNAVSAALFPRLAKAFGQPDEISRLQAEFTDSLSLVLWAVLPIGCFLVTMRHPLVKIWTGVPESTNMAAMVLVVLSVGAALNSFANPFYNAIVASGRTRALLIINASVAIALIPLLLFLLPRYELLGAALGFLFHCATQFGCVVLKFVQAWPHPRWWIGHGVRLVLLAVVFLGVAIASRGLGAMTQLAIGSGCCLVAMGVSARFVPGLDQLIKIKHRA